MPASMRASMPVSMRSHPDFINGRNCILGAQETLGA
uniref:Uncharacterized protein n=1 Tax=Asparagus officinalis TaxID=4686 RepID=Q2AA57_ASPOF|nr:hypothetical protein 19.t00013 [Asparagus officinalis]